MPEIMDVDTKPTGYISPTGEFGEGAPEKIKNLIQAKKWNNVEQMADSYLEMEKFRGKSLVIPEAEDAKGWDDVYKKLGRPDTYDKYELSYDGQVPLSEELVGSFKQFSHKLGLTQKQFDDIVKFQLDSVAAQEEAYKTQASERQAANIQAMKKKWGEAQYEPTVKRLDATAEKLGVLQFFRDAGIDKEPEIVNMLLTISNSDMEDVISPSTPKSPEKTPQQELEEIKKSEAFLKKFHPDHKAVMQRFMELNMAIANAGQARAPQSR